MSWINEKNLCRLNDMALVVIALFHCQFACSRQLSQFLLSPRFVFISNCNTLVITVLSLSITTAIFVFLVNTYLMMIFDFLYVWITVNSPQTAFIYLSCSMQAYIIDRHYIFLISLFCLSLLFKEPFCFCVVLVVLNSVQLNFHSPNCCF